jgi:hypothetical protein
MEDTSSPITVIRARDPDKLVVFHASSRKDEIRFYINHTQYITAIEQSDGTALVDAGEDEAEEKNKKSGLSINKENLKEFVILFTGLVFIMAALMVFLFLLSPFIKSTVAFLILLNTVFFAFSIIGIIVMEIKTTSPAIKSKHSAEHMMANFLEKNKRLPKDIQELKKSSRFCLDCGSRTLIDKTTDEFLSKILATIVAVLLGMLYRTFFENDIMYCIIFVVVYIIVCALAQILFKKISFITTPIKDGLTIFVQCSNTTKKVEEKDLWLAYYVAEVWMQIVYPEFCDQDKV